MARGLPNTDAICDRIFLEKLIKVYGIRVPFSSPEVWSLNIEYLQRFRELPELREYKEIMPMLTEYLDRKIEQREMMDGKHIILGGKLVKVMPSRNPSLEQATYEAEACT